MEENSSKISIEVTTMAIRETLMEYFKGTCVERLTENSSVRLRNIPASERQYQYQRREYENKKPMTVMLGGLPIATVQKAPEQIKFHDKVLTRSPQLREVYRRLQHFMDKYLQGVEVKHNRKGVFYAD